MKYRKLSELKKLKNNPRIKGLIGSDKEKLCQAAILILTALVTIYLYHC